MADLSDVMASIASIVAETLYPTGAATPTSPSTAGPVCKIYEGWPNAPELDKDLAAGVVHVSVYSMPGSSSSLPQYLDNPQIIVPAVHNVSAVISGETVTLSGNPAADEYVTLIIGYRKSYSRGGADTTAICAALLADLIADYPGSTASGPSLTISGQAELVVRIGASAIVGMVTHRQRESVQVCVFAPSPDTRTAVSKAIDGALKQSIVIGMQDTSSARVVYEKTIMRDEHETANCYRRDLIYGVEYATVETWITYEITTVNATIDTSSLATDYANGHGAINVVFPS